MGKTLTQKIFDSHEIDMPFEETTVLKLDLVMCHEITTPPAIADLVWRSKDRVFDPGRIKAVIDHVTPSGDSRSATQAAMLRHWARRHNIKDFFDIGNNGVCHALFPEKGFIRPGMTVIMGDSHTCTHGAFGAFAAGVGTTDLEVGILKGVCAFRTPKTIRVTVNGSLKPGVFAKDVILSLIAQLTVNGATNHVIEFTGPVITGMSMDERMTLSNMAVEAGATSGICGADKTTVDFLRPFLASESNDPDATAHAMLQWQSDPDAVFDHDHELDATAVVPVTTMGYKPDTLVALSDCSNVPVDQVYIGSCTNGRLSDLQEAARILRGKRIASTLRGIVSPATPHVYRQAMETGLLGIFLDAGFCVINPTCGPCLGMSDGVLAQGEVCASTTNRNFNGRMGRGGMVHLMSPASAAATALTGKLTDPRRMYDYEVASSSEP